MGTNKDVKGWKASGSLRRLVIRKKSYDIRFEVHSEGVEDVARGPGLSVFKIKRNRRKPFPVL